MLALLVGLFFTQLSGAKADPTGPAVQYAFRLRPKKESLAVERRREERRKIIEKVDHNHHPVVFVCGGWANDAATAATTVARSGEGWSWVLLSDERITRKEVESEEDARLFKRPTCQSSSAQFTTLVPAAVSPNHRQPDPLVIEVSNNHMRADPPPPPPPPSPRGSSSKRSLRRSVRSTMAARESRSR